MAYFMGHHVDAVVARWRLTNGFSLLELLLVVALIGILAAFAVPTYKKHDLWKSYSTVMLFVLPSLPVYCK